MPIRTLNDDLFFFHRDRKVVEWVYHNPDSDFGGQFVVTDIPYDELLHTFSVRLNIKTAKDYFFYTLSSDIPSTLIDKGTPEYEAELERFFHSRPDAVGVTRKSISKIVLEASEGKAEELKDYLDPVKSGKSRYSMGIEGTYPNTYGGETTYFYRDVLLYLNGGDCFVDNSSIKDETIKPFTEKVLWFSNTSFENVDFQRVNLIGTEFKNCTFKNCNFRGCFLYGSKFVDCHIKSLDFNNCILSSAQISGKTNARNITIKESEISGMKISTQPRENPKLKNCYHCKAVSGLDISPAELTER